AKRGPSFGATKARPVAYRLKSPGAEKPGRSPLAVRGRQWIGQAALWLGEFSAHTRQVFFDLSPERRRPRHTAKQAAPTPVQPVPMTPARILAHEFKQEKQDTLVPVPEETKPKPAVEEPPPNPAPVS